uniref:Uncharacterized protein n=1 Tax=Leersia perrieri TaxID=77586 RepID=A0A0D9VFR2_9ORYZ
MGGPPPPPATARTGRPRAPAVARGPVPPSCRLRASKNPIPGPSRPWLDGCCVHALLFFAVLALVLSPPPPQHLLPASAAAASVDERRRPYPCEDVARYYAGLDGLAGDELMSKLRAVVSPHSALRYKDVWDALKILDTADAHYPEASPDVIEIYSQRAVPKILAGKPDGWNREHLWPRSYGLTNGPSLTDLHNIRPADVNVNSSRGNKYYGPCASTSIRCVRPANHEAAPDTETDSERWAPPLKVRGDVSRSLMYMAATYGSDQKDGAPHLELSDSPNIQSRKMGLLSALLKWNELDPPSRSEQLRNNRVCSLYQHNRNPFVDHPEYANLIWGNSHGESSNIVRTLPKAWVNEFHYENKGKDGNEFVELMVHKALDAKDLMLVLYNGANGRMYNFLNLDNKDDFSIAGSRSSYLIYTTFIALQNGPADGIALVYKNGNRNEVLHFLSYEGSLKALDGPAKGMLSVDMMLKETDESSQQDSLGLAGNKIGDFVWRKFEGYATPGKKSLFIMATSRREPDARTNRTIRAMATGLKLTEPAQELRRASNRTASSRSTFGSASSSIHGKKLQTSSSMTTAKPDNTARGKGDKSGGSSVWPPALATRSRSSKDMHRTARSLSTPQKSNLSPRPSVDKMAMPSPKQRTQKAIPGALAGEKTQVVPSVRAPGTATKKTMGVASSVPSIQRTRSVPARPVEAPKVDEQEVELLMEFDEMESISTPSIEEHLQERLPDPVELKQVDAIAYVISQDDPSKPASNHQEGTNEKVIELISEEKHEAPDNANLNGGDNADVGISRKVQVVKEAINESELKEGANETSLKEAVDGNELNEVIGGSGLHEDVNATKFTEDAIEPVLIEKQEAKENVEIVVPPKKTLKPVQGSRKDDERSNEVNEEGISKPAEERQSKVMALIGRFETAMSG